MTLMIDFPFAGAGPWVDHFKEVELPVLRHTVHQLEELRGEAGECLAGVVGRDVHRAADHGFGPGDDGDRSGGNGGGNEVLAIHARALERAKHRAGGDLAVVDGEPGDLRFSSCGQRHTGARRQDRQLHSPSPFATSGATSVMSTSRLSSGMMPSRGPMRGTTRPTTGAAFHAAVR